MIKSILRLTVPCADDGTKFTEKTRIGLIQEDLRKAPYVLHGQKPLAFIYRHKKFDAQKPAILISTHIDSLYTRYHANEEAGILVGTFDNSATNAIAVELMRADRLHPQALVAFTGDEERDLRGAAQTMEFLAEHGLRNTLEFVLVLDLTEEDFLLEGVTLENAFWKERPGRSLLGFRGVKDMTRYFQSLLHNRCPRIIDPDDCDADESEEYGEHNLLGASLCLSCDLVIPRNMHSNMGVRITARSVKGYADCLTRLVEGIPQDLVVRGRKGCSY